MNCRFLRHKVAKIGNVPNDFTMALHVHMSESTLNTVIFTGRRSDFTLRSAVCGVTRMSKVKKNALNDLGITLKHLNIKYSRQTDRQTKLFIIVTCLYSIENTLV